MNPCSTVVRVLFCGAVLASCLQAQPLAQTGSPPNHVLDLDGTNSWIELPPNIFTNLTEATVEVWVKWDSFQAFSRVFEFGAAFQSMSLFNHAASPDLRFNIYPEYAPTGSPGQYIIRVNDFLRTNEWVHLAALSGPGGMKLYANGVLIGEHTNQASFSDIKVAQTNILGRGLVQNPGDQDFRGQIDELRVWDHRRTEAQIRAHLTRRLTGAEPGLVGLWNFDQVENMVVKDSTPAANHGQLIGNARVISAAMPAVPEAQPMDNVLTLDGTNSYVELPAGALTNLTHATVEGWVKWNSFRYMSRFVDLALSGYLFNIQNRSETPTLRAETLVGSAVTFVTITNVLQAGEWVHVAAAVGDGKLRLFLNGVLLTEAPQNFEWPSE